MKRQIFGMVLLMALLLAAHFVRGEEQGVVVEFDVYDIVEYDKIPKLTNMPTQLDVAKFLPEIETIGDYWCVWVSGGWDNQDSEFRCYLSDVAMVKNIEGVRASPFCWIEFGTRPASAENRLSILLAFEKVIYPDQEAIQAGLAQIEVQIEAEFFSDYEIYPVRQDVIYVRGLQVNKRETGDTLPALRVIGLEPLDEIEDAVFLNSYAKQYKEEPYSAWKIICEEIAPWEVKCKWGYYTYEQEGLLVIERFNNKIYDYGFFLNDGALTFVVRKKNVTEDEVLELLESAEIECAFSPEPQMAGACVDGAMLESGVYYYAPVDFSALQ